MKKKTIIIAGIDFLSVFTTIFFIKTHNEIQKEEGYIISIGNVNMILIPNGEEFDHLEVISWDFSKIKEEPPSMMFYRSDGNVDIDNGRFFVKGDNNVVPDTGFVYNTQVVGKVYGIISRDNVLQKMVVEYFISS